MKRLILMGGRPWLGEDNGKYFVEALLRYYPKSANLAFCNFAQPETDWTETEKVNKEMFSTHAGSRKLSFKTLRDENFEAGSRWADIIYLPGGDPYVLMDRLKKYDLEKLWDGKTIAGSSAGADLFCAGFTYLQEKTFGKGLGWVKATCIPHWRTDFNGYTDKDWDWAEKQSLKEHPELPVLCIPESQFVEFSVK